MKFNVYVEPDNTFQFTNFKTGKKESYDSLTMQEVLLSKYKIILDGFEPKWIRRYHAFTKIVNMKNFDKGMKTFSKAVDSFSKGMGEFEKDAAKDKPRKPPVPKYYPEGLWGNKKSNIDIWGDSKKDVKLWSDKKKFKI